MNDGKGNFYRTLNLDKESKDILKVFRKLKKEMLNEPENKKEEEE